jgi:hypothetical protein
MRHKLDMCVFGGAGMRRLTEYRKNNILVAFRRNFYDVLKPNLKTNKEKR